MTAPELLAALRGRGLGVAVEAGGLVLLGQAVASVTDEDRRLIAGHRPNLLPILRWEAAHGWRPWWPPAPEAPCPTCRGTGYALSAALGGWHCTACEPLPTVAVATFDVAAGRRVAP